MKGIRVVASSATDVKVYGPDGEDLSSAVHALTIRAEARRKPATVVLECFLTSADIDELDGTRIIVCPACAEVKKVAE